jgi:hypothetical protein
MISKELAIPQFQIPLMNFKRKYKYPGSLLLLVLFGGTESCMKQQLWGGGGGSGMAVE